MRFTTMTGALGLMTAALAPSVVHAEVLTLTFEGIADSTPVGDFYAADGITFSPATLALVDQDAGGGGNFANEPSANTIMFFLDADNAILNYAAGFETGFSFFYTSSTVATVNVYDGIGGTGNILASLALDAQHNVGCTGDPTGDFCNFTSVGVEFAGLAKSIDFGGTAGYTGFDNITFGSATPGGAVPEPGTWAMMLAGFGLVGCVVRRRVTTVAYAV
jgi:hypothetical protein